MKKNKIVMVTHSLSEAITQCVIDHRDRFDIPITVVSLQELMADYHIFDELSDSGSIIRWHKGNDHVVSNNDHFLINRVLYVPDTLFSDFVSPDREYAQRELEAYLGFALNAFTGIANKSPKGTVGEVLSLPQQWTSIKNIAEINVPNYYWGPRYNNHLQDYDRVVYSHIYDFMNWSVTPHPDAKEHLFCFEKPKGDPIFVLAIGRKHLITSSLDLSTALKIKIEEIINKIQFQSNYFIFEMLLFIDGNNINFGCINYEIIRSRKNVLFSEFVYRNLMSEFIKCIN